MPKDIGKLSLKPQSLLTSFGHLNLAVTQKHMSVTQMCMCQPAGNQNNELLLPLVSHAPTSAYMKYEVEMSSPHLDLAKFSPLTHFSHHTLTVISTHTHTN